jgi:lauroyl/myristoyl acyltransferase
MVTPPLPVRPACSATLAVTEAQKSADVSEASPAASARVRVTLGKRSNLPRIEFRKSQRRDFTYFVAAFTASLLSWVVWLLPSAFSRWLALRIGDLGYHLSNKWRENVESNLSHVLDLPASAEQIRDIARKVFQTSMLNMVDLLNTPHQSGQDILDSLHITEGDWGIVDECLLHGNGAIIVTAHLGPFDFVANSLKLKGFPLTVLTARTTSRLIFDLVLFLRRSHDLPLIEASSSGVREVMKVLQEGQCIGLATDRDFFLSGRSVEFFGEETSLPGGAARLARETGACIIPMFTMRRRGSLELRIKEAFNVPKTADRSTDLENGMSRIVRALEETISQAPEQWVMFQRVWPDDESIGQPKS